MIKAKKICGKCRGIKEVSCKCPKPKPFEGISREHQSFYNSQRWRKYSTGLRKHNPLCEECLKNNRTSPSQVVDHIIPISKGGDMWDRDNLRCLCNSCHSKKTGKSKGDKFNKNL